MKSSTVSRVVLGIAAGLAIGLGGYTFLYAKGGSYLTNDPSACANCHIMQDYYDAWIKSSHRPVAVCNDCHTPKGFVAKYANKASNGFWHSFAFTSGRFPDPLRIKPHNREITEQACRKCHSEIVDAIETPQIETAHEAAPRLSCIRCHASVGHQVRDK